MVDQPSLPEDGYHLTDDITDKALEFIRDAKAIAPEKPFFLYYAPGACHAPHHAPKEWIDKFKGQFDDGLRGDPRADARQPEGARDRPGRHGAVGAQPDRHARDAHRPGRKGSSPLLDTVRPWDSLNDDEKRLFSRMAEVYAGFLAHADHHIGRLLDYLEQTNELENTMIVVVSDNGASGEGGPNGSVNEMKFANGVPDDLAQNLAMIDELGGTKTYNHYPTGWAMAFNTPFKMWKRYEFNGGTSDPCIISWPAGMKARGEVRDQYHHAIDIVPTILDVLGVEAPETIKGHTQSPIDGVSMREQLRRRLRGVEPEDAVLRDARLPRDLARGLEGRDDASRDRRLEQLQRRRRGSCTTPTSTGPSSTTSPPSSPTSCESSSNIWFSEAGANSAFPLDDRSAVEIFDDAAASAHCAAGRVRVLPGRGARARVAGGQHQEPVVRDRQRSSTSRRPAPRACSSPTARGSAVTRSTSRTTGCTTSTTSSAPRSR